MEIEREFYEHEPYCDKDNFSLPNERGLRLCNDCAGMFDKDGNGVAVTDLRFDEGYENRPKEAWGGK